MLFAVPWSDVAAWLVLLAVAVSVLVLVVPWSAPPPPPLPPSDLPQPPFPAQDAVDAGLFASLAEARVFLADLSVADAIRIRRTYVAAGCPAVDGPVARRVVCAANVLMVARDLGAFTPAEEDELRAACWPPGTYVERDPARVVLAV